MKSNLFTEIANSMNVPVDYLTLDILEDLLKKVTYQPEISPSGSFTSLMKEYAISYERVNLWKEYHLLHTT